MSGNTTAPGERPKHDWSLPERSASMAIADTDASFVGSAPLMTVDEAERMVEGLVRYDLEAVGTSAWLEQHSNLERLNLQSHQSAKAHTDEFVLEAFLTFDKLSTLVHELLVIEAWREKVYPLLAERVVEGGASMRAYFALYHEATVINLIEVVCYHQHACEALGDIAIDLVDYCARRIGNLSRGAWFRETEPAPKSAKDLAADAENQTAGTELTKNARDVEFNASVIAVAVLRFLTQYVESLPITCLNRLIDTHDVLVAIVPLVENPPWTRCFETGEWQKLVDLKWTTVPNEELLTLTKLEAQCWLTVHHLLCNREVRARYHFNTFRQGQLLRLRRYLNEVMLDQLPVLADVQRFMDELAIMNVPEASAKTNGPDGALLMEQVAATRESIVRKRDWQKCADACWEDVFSKQSDKDDGDLHKLVDVYGEDGVDELYNDGDSKEKLYAQPIVKLILEGVDMDNAALNVHASATYVHAGLESTPLPTKHGLFRRTKYRLEAAGDCGAAVRHDTHLRAEIAFGGESPFVTSFMAEKPAGLPVMPAPDDALPAGVEHAEPPPLLRVPLEFAAKEWRQVGSLKEKCVVQVLLKKVFEVPIAAPFVRPGGPDVACYELGDSIFVCTPEAKIPV